MIFVVVYGAKIVTRVHWEILDAKKIIPKSFTMLSALFLMMTYCIFGMTMVFQYVLMMNVLCWKSMHKMIPVEQLFL